MNEDDDTSSMSAATERAGYVPYELNVVARSTPYVRKQVAHRCDLRWPFSRLATS